MRETGLGPEILGPLKRVQHAVFLHSPSKTIDFKGGFATTVQNWVHIFVSRLYGPLGNMKPLS
jgi:hypothetical protein